MAKRRRSAPNMNVTPLVDVVLVLLIIFMVVIPAMTQESEIQLPAISNADEDPKSKTDPFTLSLDAQGTMFFEKSALAPDTFRDVLVQANRAQPNRRLMLRADKGAQYADVRRVFQMVQQIGFPGISLRVNQRGGS
ncbi:MAG: biopolymer transporter ExbD [Polyangiales bacterium]|nr:biopolymer transporter ExbD [Myxococcales bacterium]